MNYIIDRNIDSNIFRGYDIRGIYGKDLDENVAYTVGLSFGTYIQKKGYKKCIVGYDNRVSSEPLSDALISGITSTGVDVVFLGLVTTPMYYFAQIHLGIEPGIMITASHNPKEFNGFKMAFDDFGNACGKMIEDFRDFTHECNFISGNGEIVKADIKDEYMNLIKKSINLGDRKIKAVIDAGNGTGSIIIEEIFSMLGIEYIPICCTSDSNFPNHHPDPSIESNNEMLKKAVLENNADIGIGIDGDADRVGIIDENGNMVYMDFYGVIIWRDIMDKVSNKEALFDIKCSKTLKDEVIKLGGTPVCYRTGNSYMKAKMKEGKYAFGVELSGHVYFADKWPGIDDGIYAGLRIIEILSRNNKSVSELLSGVNIYYSTPEYRIDSSDDKKFEIVEKVKKYCLDKGYELNDIDGVRVELPNGWALVRASNTGPVLSARFEGVTDEDKKLIEEEFMKLLK